MLERVHTRAVGPSKRHASSTGPRRVFPLSICANCFGGGNETDMVQEQEINAYGLLQVLAPTKPAYVRSRRNYSVVTFVTGTKILNLQVSLPDKNMKKRFLLFFVVLFD